MYNTSEADQAALSSTSVLDLSCALYHPLPSLKSVPLLTPHNAVEQTEAYLTGAAEDSSSRSPSRETRLVARPATLPAKVSSVVLQKWEGFVLEVGADTFTARLVTLAGDEGDQVAEIYCDEIDDEDQALLEPGAVFYWSIGYLDKPSGRVRFSQIRLRRLPVWSASELRTAEKKAEALGELMDGAVVQ